VYTLVAEPAAGALAHKTGCYGLSLEPPTGLALETVRQVFPEWKKTGVIRRPSFEPERHARLSAAADRCGVKLAVFDVRGANDLNRALKRAARESDCLLLLPDGEVFTATSLQAVLRFSVANNYPVIGYSPQMARAGAALAVYVNSRSAGRGAAVVAGRVLAGQCASCGRAANDGTLCTCENKSVAFADEVSFSVNVRACEHFHLAVGEDALRKADQVFGREDQQ
jgi:ABC-type uncharacterized transport system substrate-binding protein